MSEDELKFTIELDASPPHYAAGSEVRGHVNVRGIDERVEAVELWLEWTTVDDEPETGNTERVRVPLATRAIGGRARPAFVLKIPREPISFAGTLFSIEWHVVACVDVKWKIDPTVREPIVVDAPELARPVPAQTFEMKGEYPAAAGVAAISIAALGVGMLAGIPGIAAAGIGVGGYAAWRRVLATRARRRLGKPTVIVTPGEGAIGATMHVRVVVRPTIAMRSLHATWHLVAKESLTLGSGKTRRTSTHVHDEARGVLRLMSNLSKDREAFLEADLDIPAGGLPTFTAHGHTYAWTLAIQLQAAPLDHATFDLDHEFALMVRAR